MLKKFFIFLIDFYRICLSPLKPPTCRFYPTCSHYARESLIVHGVFRGLFLSLMRIMKCHPLCSGGYDPVPPLKKNVKRYNNG